MKYAIALSKMNKMNIKNKILKRIVDSSTLKQAEQKVLSDEGTLYKNIEKGLLELRETYNSATGTRFADVIYAPYQPLFVCKVIRL